MKKAKDSVPRIKDTIPHSQRIADLKKYRPESYDALKNPPADALLAYNVIDLRKKKKMSEQDLAEKAGVSVRKIKKLERLGLRKGPTVQEIGLLAGALKVPCARLFKHIDMTKK
ncbi:MAG: helix-turn-helix transcriptional regulator [Candidatus Paceibacterota bacterium]|jgi:DNA-binding transcriptional regulator YiaG